MNKILETIRGSWLTRDHEIAEANREYLHTTLDRILADLREKFLNVLDWSERTEKWSDIIIDGSCKDSDQRLNEIMFLEAQIKIHPADLNRQSSISGSVVESASLCNMHVIRGLADLCDLSYSVAVYVNKRMLLGSIFWGSISGVALIGTIGRGHSLAD